MSDTPNVAPQGGAAPPAPTQEPNNQPLPRNDAEAAAMEAAQKAAAPTPEAEAEKAAAEERKRNRTSEYIKRLQTENAELRRQQIAAPSAQPNQSQPPQSADKEPRLEDYDFDIEEYTRAHSKWTYAQESKARAEAEQRTDSAAKQQETIAAYQHKAADFAADHPDFPVVVGTMKLQLAPELQLAIMAHENGPAIAYHIALNDEAAFELAQVQPQYAAWAVDRIASRLSAAPQVPDSKDAPNNAALAAVSAQPTKPISQAPAPAPTVTGRSPTDTPAEKLTDDEWYARDRERRRKR